jgi:hypothetical protein
MFGIVEVSLDDLEDALSAFVRKGPQRNIWQAIIHVTDKELAQEEVVTIIEVQIDKTFKHHLTIQTIEVSLEYQRRGLCRACVQALKKASVNVGRVAHVESVHNEHMDTLLRSEDFYPSDDGYCYEWKPLTLQSWVVNTSSFRMNDETHSVHTYAPKFKECVSQLTNIWKESIPGMEIFPEHAKWFAPETDLEKISHELGIPTVALKDFREDKACFGMSSFFTEVYKEYYVIEGLAVDPSFGPIALEHACLCRIKKGKIYVFDLVRKNPLLMYGVVVRSDMKKKLNEKCKDTWAGYSVINGLNYIKSDVNFF